MNMKPNNTKKDEPSLMNKLSHYSFYFLCFTILMTVIFLIVTATIPARYNEDNVIIRDNEWAFWCFVFFLALSFINCGMCFHIDGGSVTATLFDRVNKIDKRVDDIEKHLNIDPKHTA